MGRRGRHGTDTARPAASPMTTQRNDTVGGDWLAPSRAASGVFQGRWGCSGAPVALPAGSDHAAMPAATGPGCVRPRRCVGRACGALRRSDQGRRQRRIVNAAASWRPRSSIAVGAAPSKVPARTPPSSRDRACAEPQSACGQPRRASTGWPQVGPHAVRVVPRTRRALRTGPLAGASPAPANHGCRADALPPALSGGCRRAARAGSGRSGWSRSPCRSPRPARPTARR